MASHSMQAILGETETPEELECLTNSANVKQEFDINSEDISIKLERYHTREHNENTGTVLETARSFMDKPDDIFKTLVEKIHEDFKNEMEMCTTRNDEGIGIISGVFSNTDHSITPDETEIKVENKNMDEDLPTEFDGNKKDVIHSTKIQSTNEIEVKKEVEDSIVSYDFPQFDAHSMDSGEGMDHCMQDGNGIKTEMEEDNDDPREQFENVHVKLDPDFDVTETHLISNKMINTTSTITHPQDGVIESQTTTTLVMEIRPMTSGSPFMSTNNPDTILSTSESEKVEDFQLNSITGDALPLEAYGLLDTSKVSNLKNMHYCPRCPKECKSKYLLNRHLKVHDTIDNYAKGAEMRKQRMLENAEKKRLLKLQVDNKDLYQCTCEKTFRRRSRMETCLRSHDEVEQTCRSLKFNCMYCAKQCDNKDDLVAHRKRMHNTRKKFPCKFCPSDYHTRKELFKHLRIHQKVQLMEYKVISEFVEGNQKLKCFLCSKAYTDLSHLKTHVMSGHKEPYKCPHCKQKFPKLTEFATHSKTHPDIEGQSVIDVLEAFSKLAQSWKCIDCDIQFKGPDEMALHQLDKHKDIKITQESEQFQCEDCRRAFASNKSLNTHRRAHHNIEDNNESTSIEKGFLCVYCRKICKDENALTSHMRLHSADRKYACKFCDFRFATVEKRRSHADIHTGDMPYVCFICEYQCSSVTRLRKHKKSAKHLSMKDYLLTGEPLPTPTPTPTPTPKEEKESLKEKESVLKRKSSEGNERESSSNECECDVCGKRFSSNKKMLHHKLKHPFIEFPNEDQPSRIFFK